jgi:cyclic-di-GMP-binding protein
MPGAEAKPVDDLELPELVAHAAPEFIDEHACKAWLENVPLANVATAQRQLYEQISEFNRFPTKALVRLGVMETLREAVNFVQIEQAKRFTNRALPMVDAEARIFQETIALWDEMRIGYMRCLDSVADGEPGIRAQSALVAQRALAYIGLKMFHYYRAYRQVPPRDWHLLHEAYANAEALGVEDEAVKDYLNRDVHDTSPRIAYIRAVMIGACNPNELGQRQLTFVAYLLERWAEKVDISRRPIQEEDLAPMVIDLMSDRTAERIEDDDARFEEPRYLGTQRLAKSLRNRIGLLRKGESPAKLALGEDCVQPSCEQLLVFLYRQWCQPRPGRGQERRRIADAALVCQGLPAIHYYICGRAFRQPGEQRELTQKQRQEIATFGRIRTSHEDDYGTAQGFALEEWRLENDSAQGLRMVRAASESGKRYSHGQLLSVRPVDSNNFMLGQVRWLMIADNGDLQAGVRLLPGLPAETAVRATGLNAIDAKYVQALSLTAVPALDAPPTLVLPSGWYKPKRVVEVYVDSAVRVRLTELIERGSDFERVAYEILP